MNSKKFKIVIFSLLLLLFSGGYSAHAHVDVSSTNPVDGSVFPVSPKEAVLTFEGLVDPTQVSATLRDAKGNKLDNPVRTTPPGPSTNVKFSLPTLKDNTYLLGYRAYSSDGHIVEGEISFTVGNVVAEITAKKIEKPQAGRTFEVVARYFFDFGLIIVVGALFWLITLMPRREDPKNKNKLFKDRDSEEKLYLIDFFQRFILFGSSLIATGVLLRLLSFLSVAIPGSSSEYRWSLFTNKTIIIFSISFILSIYLLKIKNIEDSKIKFEYKLLGLLSPILYLMGNISHAADQPLAEIDALLWVFHLLLISLWVGPVIIYIIAFFFIRDSLKEDINEGIRQYMPLGIFSVLCAIITGLTQAYVFAGGELPSGEYLAVIIGKIFFVIFAIIIGGYNSLRILKGKKLNTKTLLVEILLLLIAVSIATILATTSPF